MIIPMSQAHDVAQTGGKAASLARLMGKGFDVPPFLVIPAEAFQQGDQGPKPHPDLASSLAEALTDLAPGPFAVRSSARSEDGAAHSHAGQFDTLLNVAADGVLDAAARVWASGFGATVEAYRDLKSGGPAEAPAILVQRMVPASAAGVAFSADPVSGERDTVVISAIAGLGEALVSGEADGEDWRITGTATQGPDAPTVLSADQAEAVAALARACEAAYDHPQDIEWAFDADQLYLLQSRPITTALKDPARPDAAITVLDNSNIVESYPGLVSPLTFSFAAYSYNRVYRAFVSLLGLPQRDIDAQAAVFSNLLARVDGRVYYNLGNWYRALALLPGFSLNRGFMETMMGVDEPLPPELTEAIAADATQGKTKAGEVLKLTRVGLGLLWQALRLEHTKRGFYARLKRSLKAGARVETGNLTELAALYRQVEGDLLDRWDAPLVNDFLCMMGFGASRKILEKWAGADGLTFHNDFMIGQGDIVSAEPAQRIATMGRLLADHPALTEALQQEGRGAAKALPDLQQELDAYLTKFGDRCTEELKLESIPLSDDPAPLLAAISAAARAPAQHRETSDPDWDALIANPVKRHLARWISTWARNRVRDRENLRFERTRIFGLARRIFLAMGRELTALGHLDRPRDVLMLRVDELLAAAEGGMLSSDLRGLVRLRQGEMDQAAKRPDPPERITGTGAPLGLTNSAPPPEPAPSGPHRQGTGCSAGEVTAKARVIRDPRTEALDPGEILVARNTDPGWIAVFANASAIVVERGSLLSHSAIVARELGIPCVVGLKGATEWVGSNDSLYVNGATGDVRKTNDE